MKEAAQTFYHEKIHADLAPFNLLFMALPYTIPFGYLSKRIYDSICESRDLEDIIFFYGFGLAFGAATVSIFLHGLEEMFVRWKEDRGFGREK